VIETCAKILEVSAKWPQAQKKVIEYAANGPTVIALLRREISGLIPCTPEGDKKHRVLMAGNNDREREARGLSMQVMFHSGNVYVPHPDIPGHGWVHAYIHELCSFPTAPHDDDVDMTSQALMHLQPGAWHFEDRKAKEEEDAKPVALNPKAQFERGMHDQIKKVLRGYEKAQKTKNPGMGAVGL
jgi:predicted phage terminase large subunit-like protein